MIDLNYGERYKAEIDLKNKIESKIAKNLMIPKEQVLLNYGANSHLMMLIAAYTLKSFIEYNRPLNLLIDLPNYFFTLKQIAEWKVNAFTINRNDNFDLSIEDFISKLNNYNPDVVIITSPNNPTGKPIKDEDLFRILDNVSDSTTAIIDRCCLNVLPQVSTKELLHKYSEKNIIILHSFSKSHSLSDERVGYIATNQKDIGDFLYHKRDLNHNINAVTKCYKLLGNNKLVQKKKNILSSCHKILENYFSKNNNGKYFKSFSNFAIIRLPQYTTSDLVENYLAKKGILVMGGHKIGIGHSHIRIHMSGAKEIRTFLKFYEIFLRASHPRPEKKQLSALRERHI